MTIRIVPYKEARLDHFKAVREKRKKTLHWWKYQKPGKEYYGLTIRGRCSELESEISYLDDVIEMLEKAGVEG
ncbi:MAG: hypothetical protein GX562_07705 [Coriobacteriaceae bacterium]|nr:hypothetical protein [Coriobacteriaceae bacterium]